MLLDAKTGLVAALIGLATIFVAAPLVSRDEVVLALGLPYNGFTTHTFVRQVTMDQRDPELSLSLGSNGQVIVEGILPDMDTSDRVLNRAEVLYGQDQYVDKIEVAGDVRYPPWLEEIELLMPSRMAMVRGSSISVKANQAEVAVRFASKRQRKAYLDAIKQELGEAGLAIEDKTAIINAGTSGVSHRVREEAP